MKSSFGKRSKSPEDEHRPNHYLQAPPEIIVQQEEEQLKSTLTPFVLNKTNFTGTDVEKTNNEKSLTKSGIEQTNPF
jgi:hypothetical protein